MDAGNWITIGAVIISAVGQVMYFKGRFATLIEANAKDIRDIEHDLEVHKGKVRYTDVCDAMHDACKQNFEGRMVRVENQQNGKKAS